jgi:uncharacterized protein VirK/YbjX
VDDIIFMRHDFEQKKRFDALVYSYKKLGTKIGKKEKINIKRSLVFAL